MDLYGTTPDKCGYSRSGSRTIIASFPFGS